MSEINPKENENASTEKSSNAIKRKLETTDSPGLNDKKELEVAKSEAKKQKTLPSVKEQEKKSDKTSKINDKPGPSGETKKTYEDDFNKHPDLHLSYELVYEPCEIACTSKPKRQPEGEEYGAFDFSLDQIQIKFRVAKTTPTKVGQFVTLWKRIGKGPTMPYDTKDPTDVFVICVREGKNFGQFIFSKNVLASENILSKSGKGGKRAIRVYAPWVKTTNSQATNTKSWQTRYFINLSDAKKIDLGRVRRLYGFK